MKWLITLSLAATVMLTPLAMAHPTTQSSVVASHAWMRILPGSLPAGGYVTLSNKGDKEQAMTGADSTAYKHVMLHHSTTESGVSHMRMIKQLPLPAHTTVKLAPGGYHLMFMHAKQPVKASDSVPVTLHFADGSTLKVTFLARPANASSD